AVIIIISMVFLHPILKLLGATDSILPYAATYAGIYIVSCIFNVFNVTMNNIVTSEGAAKTTMCALLTGAVLNIALDPLFIYVFDLGVAGAAIATAISQIVSTCVYLTYIFRKKSVFHFRVKDCTYAKETMSEIFKIGIPTLVFQILTSVSISLINNAAGDYGDSAIAGMGVVTRLISMGSLSVFGFIKGFQPIAGYSYGAKKFDRLREAIKTSILWSTVFCVIFGVILALFPTAIVSQFTKGDAKMIRIGAASLRANGISIMLFGFYTVYSSLFLALGKGREGFILGACRQGICFIPVILLLPIVWGLNGIMYAQPIADVLSAVITVFMAIPLHKKLNDMQKQTTAISTKDND
ncbi:MATE family efflux transporter, partial [Bacteroides caecimuris]|uniref:MATE family efflux transporter n=1 Tax=Bacteroides caecimuris TaxID=1796613 RepID=UPI00257053AC